METEHERQDWGGLDMWEQIWYEGKMMGRPLYREEDAGDGAARKE